MRLHLERCKRELQLLLPVTMRRRAELSKNAAAQAAPMLDKTKKMAPAPHVHSGCTLNKRRNQQYAG
jgi:hypothetical protein